jgi:hypothetical protein
MKELYPVDDMQTGFISYTVETAPLIDMPFQTLKKIKPYPDGMGLDA